MNSISKFLFSLFISLTLLFSLPGSTNLIPTVHAAESEISVQGPGNRDVSNFPALDPVFKPLATPNVWNSLNTGLNGRVLAIAVSGTYVYVGGNFTDAGGDANADYIARWNGTQWSALGSTPLNNIVSSIGISGGNLYAGGGFTDAGGDGNADYIARWDGINWNALGGTPLSNNVNAIAINGTDVYAGGWFTDAGGDANADRIAKWNGTSWSSLGSVGLNDIVNDIAVINSFEVYVTGKFTDVNGNTNIDRIAKFSNGAWSALGTGLNGDGLSLIISGSNIYVGGSFTDAGGNTSADRIARFNGGTWFALGSGLSGNVYDIGVSATQVYAAGDFTNAGGDLNADRIAKWNGTSWVSLGSTPLNNTIYALAISGGDIYAGGDFTDAGGNASGDSIARFETPSATLTVDTPADESNSDGDCSLREAVTAANTNTAVDDCGAGSGADTIVFDNALGAATITLGSQIIISGANGLTIDGGSDISIRGNGSERLFYIDTSTLFILKNLTLYNGMSSFTGGAISMSNQGEVMINNSSLHDNFGTHGGAIYNLGGNLTIVNSTLMNNQASNSGGQIHNTNGAVTTIINSTLSNHAALIEADGIYNSATLFLTNVIIANSINGDDCINSGGVIVSKYSLIEAAGSFACGQTNGVDGNIIGSDPNLGSSTGSPPYFPLNIGSPAINAGRDGTCAVPPVNNTSQNGALREDRGHCDIGAYELPAEAEINVFIGGEYEASYELAAGASIRPSFSNVNGGPVKLDSTNTVPIIASERVLYKVNGVDTSFSEMLALPDSQLDNTYWLPWYNNVTLDTQLRIGNVTDDVATVHVFIGGAEMLGSPFNLDVSGVNQSKRISFTGINAGPVQVVSDVDIVVSERVLYKVNGVDTSFSEMLALPDDQLNNIYWLPWYNNVTLDTQLRLGNVSGGPASVQVFIGGTEMVGSPISLDASGVNQSKRISFAGINAGPVQIVSDVDIVVSERVLYNVNGVDTSFSEMLAIPEDQMNDTYWLPWYNNVTLDTQLRVGNVSGGPATVQVFIGGNEMVGSPFNLDASGANQSKRISFAGINAGPVQIVSDADIVVSERVLYNVNGVDTSFSEMTALPNNQLNTAYWLPWYNNVTLDTQLRIGVP